MTKIDSAVFDAEDFGVSSVERSDPKGVLRLEAFGNKRLDMSSSTSLKAELLGP